MAQFTPKLQQLLLDYLTDLPARQISVFFEDNGVNRGPAQDNGGDQSVR